jgi:hypothetical protein
MTIMGNLFHKVFEVDTSTSQDALWKIISSTQNVTEFWHGTKWIKHLGGVRYRIRFAFPAKGIVDFIYDEDRKTAKEIYVKGPFKGEKTLSISQHNNKSMVRVEWNVRFTFPYSMFTAKMCDHMSLGTSNAINRIITAASNL